MLLSRDNGAGLAKEGLDIVVVDADLGKSTTARKFKDEYPDRFFGVGIAEANMIGVSCGLAAAGKIAFCSTFAVFLPSRCYDQIRVSVAQTGMNVKMVASHAGISVGPSASLVAAGGVSTVVIRRSPRGPARPARRSEPCRASRRCSP